jgi:hypothetical protein
MWPGKLTTLQVCTFNRWKSFAKTSTWKYRWTVKIRRSNDHQSGRSNVHYKNFQFRSNVLWPFFSGDSPITKQNKYTCKFIPYHLIIPKHEYYVIKLYMFHDLFLHYILCHLSILWHLSISQRSIDFFRVTQNHPNFSTNKKACTIEN